MTPTSLKPSAVSNIVDAQQKKDSIFNLLHAPKFGNPAKDRLASLQQVILMVLFLTTLLGMGVSLLFLNSTSVRGLALLLLEMFLTLLAFYWQRHGHLEQTSWVLVGTMYLVFILACTLSGFTFPIALLLALMISLTGLLLPYYSVVAVTAISLITIWALPYMVAMPIHIKPNEISYASVILVLEGALLTIASRTLEQSFAEADQSTQNLMHSNIDLQNLTTNLEQRVAERTKALSQQALQLQAAIEVSRAISSILDVDELIQKAVDLARDRFDLYYVGLFLLKDQSHLAVLAAGTGEAGIQMLASEHTIGIDDRSIIGWCINHKEAKIALSAGNSLLPNTHSEMVLPLISQGKVIGALTIQSEQESAFIPEDITILQTMTDQLANGIEKARLYEQIQQRAIELDRAREFADNAKNDIEKARVAAEEANRNLAAQMWQTAGQASLNDKMRGEQDVTTLAYTVIQHLCKYLEVENGAIYTLEDNAINLTGTYAYRQKSFEQQYQLGEDQVGQVALTKEIITHQIPNEYIAASLRLGKLLPRFRLIAPVVYNQQVSGVVVLESMSEFTVAQKHFLEQVSENVAIAFATAQARTRVDALFSQTRQQAEKLQAQEEELRASNEELEAQTESLRALTIYQKE